MPSRQWFEPQSEQLVKDALLLSKQNVRERQDGDLDLSLSYMDGSGQVGDCRAQLAIRYAKTQVADSGQQISPVVVPILQRFIDDAATAYNRTIKRKLVEPDGSESKASEEETKKYNAHLDDIGFDETMHTVERAIVGLRSCGIWWQAKRGALNPIIAYPQYMFPLCDQGAQNPDAGDQQDLAGIIVALSSDVDDTSSARAKRYALVTPPQVTYYEAGDPYQPEKILSQQTNPLTWEQKVDTDTGFIVKDAPLQMVTILNREKTVGTLFPKADIDLVLLNREINVQLSVLLDTMRVQCGSNLIFNTMNPALAPSSFSYGTRFAFSLGPTETASFINAQSNYDKVILVLQDVIKMAAMSQRSSPNDFSTSGQNALSGFAKLVDSLPKIERRDEHTARMARLEQTLCWPRMCSAMVFVKVLSPAAKRMKLVTQFDKMTFPLSTQEQVALDTFDLANGIRSKADIMAARLGITHEQAEERIKENEEKLAETKAEEKPPQETNQPQMAGILGEIVRRRSKITKGE